MHETERFECCSCCLGKAHVKQSRSRNRHTKRCGIHQALEALNLPLLGDLTLYYEKRLQDERRSLLANLAEAAQTKISIIGRYVEIINEEVIDHGQI